MRYIWWGVGLLILLLVINAVGHARRSAWEHGGGASKELLAPASMPGGDEMSTARDTFKYGTEEAPMLASAGGAVPPPMPQSPGSPSPDSSGPPLNAMDQSTDRYLIRNGHLELEAKDVLKVAAQIDAAVKAAQGYSSSRQESRDPTGIQSVAMTVRVPADKFDSFMDGVSGFATVINRSESTEDVTEEYVDTEAALTNLKATEARLLDHMHDSQKLADTLAIEQELTRVLGEIQQREGRLKFLAHRVTFSTIDISISQAASAERPVPVESFSTAQVATSTFRSVVEFARGIWAEVVVVGVWGIVWIPLVLIALWLVRRGRRRGVTAP